MEAKNEDLTLFEDKKDMKKFLKTFTNLWKVRSTR